MRSISLIILITISVFFIFNAKFGQKIKDIQYVSIGDVEVKVYVASTPTEHAQGLSGRQSLDEGEGLLFVFDKLGEHPIWMKNMHFSIDIIWLDEDLKIVFIKKDARPESFPELFGSTEESLYVLEVVSGFTDDYRLRAGDMMEFAY